MRWKWELGFPPHGNQNNNKKTFAKRKKIPARRQASLNVGALAFWLFRSMLWWRKKEIKKNVKEQSTRCCYNGEKGWQEEEWKEGKKRRKVVCGLEWMATTSTENYTGMAWSE